MNPTGRDAVAVFGASQAVGSDYEAGVECGRRLADAGFTVVSGGYGGIMEAVCRGAVEAGGATIGVTAPSVFPGRAGANRWVEHEIAADDLVHRIGILMSLASGYMVLPGSLGTLTELIMAWNLAFVAPFSRHAFGPIVAVGQPWQRLVPHLATTLQTDGGLITTTVDVAAGVDALVAALA